MANNVKHLLCIYLPSLHVLMHNVSSYLLISFLFKCFFTVESWEYFVCSILFLLLCLSFVLLTRSIDSKIFNIDEVRFINLISCESIFSVMYNNSVSKPSSQDFLLFFLLKSIIALCFIFKTIIFESMIHKIFTWVICMYTLLLIYVFTYG